MGTWYLHDVWAKVLIANSTGNESNFRTSAYEALSSYVTHAGPESIPVVQNIALTILSRMEHLLAVQNQLLNIDDRNNWNELQSNLCSVIVVCGYPISHLEQYLSWVYFRASYVSWATVSSPWRTGL